VRFEVQEITVSIMMAALTTKARYGLSYWDAAIVAAVRVLGCRELYFEDVPTAARSTGRPSSIRFCNFGP
jgi:predicted nucleic acid-binding protein